MSSSKVAATARLAIIPAIVALAVLIAWKTGYFDLDRRQALVSAVERARELPGIHILFPLMFAVAIALCLPSNVGTMLAGAVFGVWLGGALALLGGLLATAIGYTMARTVARRPMKRLFGEHRLLRALKDHDGVLPLFRLRVIPVAPFAVLTYVAGIAGVSLRRLLAATAIGGVPMSLVHAFVGTMLLRGLSTTNSASKRALLIAASLTATMLLISYVVGIVRRRAH